MSIERFESNGRYHKAIKSNGFLYISGQTSSESNTVKGQATEVLEKIEELLVKYGSDKRHMVNTCVYLKSIESFNEFNSVWDFWVESGFEPTRACIETRLARPELLVEVTVVAELING